MTSGLHSIKNVEVISWHPLNRRLAIPRGQCQLCGHPGILGATRRHDESKEGSSLHVVARLTYISYVPRVFWRTSSHVREGKGERTSVN